MPENNIKDVTLRAPIVLLAVTAVIIIAWTTGPFGFHFGSTGLVNIYSFFQLFTTAYIAFLACKDLEKESSLKWRQNPSARPFFLSAIGFLFLGLDDLLSIHESIDRLIHAILRMKVTPLTDHIDDLIMLMYGVIAVFFIKDFVREFKKHPRMAGLIVCGFIIFFVMASCDFVSNNDETFAYFFKGMDYSVMRHRHDLLSMAEDSLKLLGEAFFLAAFVAAFTDIRTKKK